MTLGGLRIEVERPRMGAKDGDQEVPLRTYEHFADRDRLARVVLERMLAGVSTCRYTQQPVGEQVEIKSKSTSKGSVSRTSRERTKRALGELMSRPLADMRLAAMMIDALEL